VTVVEAAETETATETATATATAAVVVVVVVVVVAAIDWRLMLQLFSGVFFSCSSVAGVADFGFADVAVGFVGVCVGADAAEVVAGGGQEARDSVDRSTRPVLYSPQSPSLKRKISTVVRDY